MRQVVRGLAIVVLASSAAPAGAQQGSIQVSAAAQALTGDPARLAGQRTLEPDVGMTWLQPGSRFGTFNLELHGTNRTGRPHLGRAYVALRDLKHRGVSWTVEGGDAYVTPSIGEYRFSNLFTPAVTFSGAAVSGVTRNSSITALAGRATAWRNIFGSDPDTLGQTLGVVKGTHRLSPQIEVQARGSDIRTRGLKEFGYSIATSRQAGGGMKWALTPVVQVVADASQVWYRREGTDETRRDTSFLAGTSFLLARGWLQINAFRFSPGEFPALNYPLQDREGVFGAGEYDLSPRLRLFAGWDGFRANLDPDGAAASAQSAPRTTGARVFGGMRVSLWPRSALTLRVEDGDRIAKPVRPGFGAPTDSDTGSWSAEWQGLFGPTTAFTRYARRENVDRANLAGSYTQHDASAQVFVNLSRAVQLFGLALVTETVAAEGGGNTYWQAGGGTQVQVPRRRLWMRAEGTLSRNIDLLTEAFVPRESLSVGLSGHLTPQTSIALNVYVDRAPAQSLTGSPWTTRSTLRLTHTLSTGAARVAEGGSGPAAIRPGGTGSILGNVFADWNANGILDADENPLEGIPVRVAAIASARTARNGQFSFLNVPAGLQDIGLDTTALPIDFDPPAEPTIEIELTRGETRRVAFGLIPLGSITGRVVRDVNGNGVADPGEEPLDGVVVSLDGGMRSEQTRRGRFRFDAVRSGEHTVQVLLDSIGEGAKSTAGATLPAVLTRDQLTINVTFLVSIEKRPEIRKVFPSKAGESRVPRSGSRAAAAGVGESRPTPVRASNEQRPRAVSPSPPAGGYTVQVAALRDRNRAETLVQSLRASGFAAYLVEPLQSESPALFRIRVGQYATISAADQTRVRLELERKEKAWITRADRERGSDVRAR